MMTNRERDFGVMNLFGNEYVIRIHKNETYHLYPAEGGNPVKFTSLLKLENLDKEIPLQKKHGRAWEDVGTLTLRQILMMPAAANPIWHTVKKAEPATTYSDFIKRSTTWIQKGQ